MSSKPPRSFNPLSSLLSQAQAALSSALILHQDGAEDGDMEQIVTYISVLLDRVNAVAFQNLTDLNQLVQFMILLKAQRDEALGERDTAQQGLRDAYLEGILTVEEARLNTDWQAFGISRTFSLDWLEELLSLSGDDHSAGAVHQVKKALLKCCAEAEAYLLGLNAGPDDAEDGVPF